MYKFFKCVLRNTIEAHKKMINGRSSCSKKLENELKDIKNKLYETWKYGKQLTDEQYLELQKQFDSISFMNLSAQRNGKKIL